MNTEPAISLLGESDISTEVDVKGVLGATTEMDTPTEMNAATEVMVNLQQPLDKTDPLAGTSYQVLQPIGAGGMGQVYCAQHRQLGQLVAVKVLLLNGEASPQTVVQSMDRARLEAQVGARLRHPNLVAVSDSGFTAAGLPFLAMELLDGLSLHDMLVSAHNGPLPLATSLDVICQTLAGLSAVHKAGLIHRDIKPTNIFVCKDGTVKLLDLGCAKVIEYASAATPDSLAMPTEVNIYLGSPRYTAPEQASLANVDRRADLYAIGCVLYRLLCGRGPFDEARTFQELRRAHTRQQPAPASHHLHTPLPAALDAALLRCLAKSPDDRPQSADALAEELRRIETGVRETLGSGYITETLTPATTMGESQRLWQPPPMPVVPPPSATAPPGSFTMRQMLVVVAVCLVMGMMLGGLVVAMRGGQ